MANKFNQSRSSEPGRGPSTTASGPTPSVGPIKTAAWPGLPGKSQSRDRSNGVKKVTTRAKSEGV